MKKIIKVLGIICVTILMLLISESNMLDAFAAAPYGIYGNGTNGIYIDINGTPYTTYANKSYGQYAYTNAGCAWFASARANQITGIDTAIWSGASWYNSAYSYYGYSRGATLKAKALACYENHVAVVESVNGNTVTVSEGGYLGTTSNYGYCAIHTMSKSTLESARGGNFLGYVYLTGAPSVQMTFDWDDCQPSKNDVYVYERANPGVTGTFTEAGITFWDSLGRYVGSKTEYINTTYSYLEMWYTASGDLGVSLQPGTIYSYQFYTVYNGTRYNGPVKSFATVWNETFALATPKLVSVTQGNGSVTVKCEPVSGSVGYRFYRRTGNSTYWEVMADLQQTTFVDTAVKDGEKYTYTVRAYRDNIEMANANTYSTTYWSDYDPNGLGITYKVIKEGWQKDSIGWWYRNADGSYPYSCWKQIGSKWYYFNASGYRLQNQWIGNYYVKSDGVMATSQWVGSYYVDASGAYISRAGWLQVNGNWYYLGNGGVKQTGWQYVGGVWYYLNANGIMQTDWLSDGGQLYFLSDSGAMISNKWKSSILGWHYMTSSGAAAVGWAQIGSAWYYFDSNNNCIMVKDWNTINGTRYYFNRSGAMVTGWQLINGTWYFFHGSGAMAANQWVGNYYLQSDGSMATNKWIGQYYVGADGAWIP